MFFSKSLFKLQEKLKISKTTTGHFSPRAITARFTRIYVTGASSSKIVFIFYLLLFLQCMKTNWYGKAHQNKHKLTLETITRGRLSLLNSNETNHAEQFNQLRLKG